MIIKKVNIKNFGGIKNKEINFSTGFNIIYGENEAGKSTIQSFIKIWLYGFSSYKGKDYKINERLKYTDINAENISGELYINFQNKEYIIKRTFGKSKKEDMSIIINAVTGEEIKGISKEEPGKFFLKVNRSTFINTIFTTQLGVVVKEDKEEELLDKILLSIGTESGQASFNLALLKLENYKKSITNIRKNGKLDRVNNKYSELVEEKYQAYKLSENNLENEKILLILNEEKIALNSYINNLEIYKKHIKGVKLKKEFEQITEYLKKKKELEEKKRYIDESLNFNEEILNYSFINNLKQENFVYLNLLKLREKESIRFNCKKEEIENFNNRLNEYMFIDNLDSDILNILESLKLKREVLREKKYIRDKIINEIELLKFKENEIKKDKDDIYKIKESREKIEDLVNTYEKRLKELKCLIENGSNKTILDNNFIYLGLGCIAIILMFSSMVLKSLLISVTLCVSSIILIAVIWIVFYISKSKFIYNRKVNGVKKSIQDIEGKLDSYVKKFKVNNYSELFRKLKLYDNCISFEEKISEKLSEKQAQIELLGLNQALLEYDKVNNDIKRYLYIAKLDGIDELIDKIKKYKELHKEFKVLQIELNGISDTLENILHDISKSENEIKKKLKSIGFENVDLVRVNKILEELEDKIKSREDVMKRLVSVEEVYSNLSMGKDLEVIKNEIENITNSDLQYPYQSEEEIDEAIRSKNLRLLDVEKKIKDIENEIKNRFSGKRMISEIEEEIKNTEDEINTLDKQFKASNIALEVLNKAYNEIREDFGPILNKNVTKAFEVFTNNKYKNVMVSDKYEMKVCDENNILQGEVLSSGTNDQLYLSLRLAFIEMIFKNKDVPICLDDSFIQYDDIRIENAIEYLKQREFIQYIIFTCQKREEAVLRKNNISYKYIKLVK